MRCSVCDMTHDRACVDACPEEALVWDDGGRGGPLRRGALHDVRELPGRCPNVHLDAVGERIMICDLCDGDPLCVKWCPEGALTWEVRA